MTDATGNYSITMPAGVYALYLNGSNIDGMNSFNISQSTSNPGVNLNYGNTTQNLTLPTATLTVTGYNNSGSQGWNTSVSARTTSGTTVLYPGDTGMSLNISSAGFNTASNPTGTLGTLIGASYAANGLETTNSSNSICETIPNIYTQYDCLLTPFNVTSNATLGVPSTLPVTRTLQGQLVDSTNRPLPNVTVQLLKYGDSSVQTSTDSNGFFKVSALPKAYYMKLTGSTLGGLNFTLTQSASNPSINLSSANIAKDMQLNTVMVTVNANDANGQPDYFTTVNAKPSGGTATLYTGDPGFAISASSVGFSTTPASNAGTVESIVGSTYAALGLNVSNPNGSICERVGTTSQWNCLTTAFTTSTATTINTPY